MTIESEMRAGGYTGPLTFEHHATLPREEVRLRCLEMLCRNDQE